MTHKEGHPIYLNLKIENYCSLHNFHTPSTSSHSRAGQLTWHNGKIPHDKLFVKIGGDHGQGSMKLEFQLANVIKPNSSKITVVFVIYEGKDTRNNLQTVLQQHADSLRELTALKIK